MVFKWREGHTPLFLECYEKYPCLWDFKLEDYKDKVKRAAAIRSFIKDLNVEGVTPLDVRLKIKSIRTRYSSELKRVRKSIKDGGGEIYVPKLYWFEQADKFLNAIPVTRDPAKTTRRTSSNDSDSFHSSDAHRQELGSQSNTTQNFEEMICVIDSPYPKTIKKSLSSDFNEFQAEEVTAEPESTISPWDNNKIFKRSESMNSTPASRDALGMVDDRMSQLRSDDECDIIGKNVAAKLRTLLPIQKIYAEKIINDTLFEAQLNNLSRYSRLLNPS